MFSESINLFDLEIARNFNQIIQLIWSEMLNFFRISIVFSNKLNQNDRMWTKNDPETNFVEKVISIFLSGSRAFYESIIYTNNNIRELRLQDMRRTNNYSIASSKEFLANMREAITQQNGFIKMFAIQPDPDEQNELNIGKNNT